VRLIDALHTVLGQNDVMAYLVMMTVRLVEMRRVLKDTGSLYLHCDPTASHYLKLVLDQIFGPTNFRNEIVWAYTRPGTKYQRQLPRTHDTILWYSKSNTTWIFNTEGIRIPYSESTIERGKYSVATSKMTKEISKRVLPTGGKCPEDWWQIPMIQGNAQERLGYPTQKLLALLERIIKASSNEGDIVLDPFCGCGTALAAAYKLNRRWIGIDITHLAIKVMGDRLRDSFPGIQFEVVGEPADVAGARALAHQKPDGRYQFQYWALSRISAQPLGEKKKGADKGIDGVVSFTDEYHGKAKRALVQVKSGHVHVKDIRELKTVAANDALGIFITLEPPTKEMQVEAVSAGFYHSPLWDKDYPKIQILTIEELFQGKVPEMLPAKPPFPKAQKVGKQEGKQIGINHF
jgi:site-specific DNA-methyltransferase (adenine-specific)